MIKQLHAYGVAILILSPSHLMSMSQQEKNKALYDAVRNMRQAESVESSTSDHLVEKRQEILRLINDGADPSWCLHEATQAYKGTEDSMSVLELLLDCKASVEYQDVLGTPLMSATMSRNFNAVALLLQKGASPKGGGYKVLYNSVINIFSTRTIDEFSDALALTALLVMHPTTEIVDIASIYKEVDSSHMPYFDRTRQLACLATVQAIKKKMAVVNVLTRDTAGIVAAYAGCYHHIEGHLLEEDELHAQHAKALEKIIAAIVS